jgi:hypothetical protein
LSCKDAMLRIGQLDRRLVLAGRQADYDDQVCSP